MSPPSDHVPRTPDRRSSSTAALFTAFRTLTGGRLKSQTPPPSLSSGAGTPARTPSLSALRPSPVASPHSADDTLLRLSRVSQRSGQPVTGGPPELEELVAQLGSDNAFLERAAAVESICRILEQYPIQNVLGLWSVASDLLLPEQPDSVAEEGYKLLLSCVSWPKLSSIERSILFDAASLRKNDRYFDRRLQVVNALTKRGRDVEACESSIVSFVVSSLDVCYKARRDAANASRKANGKRSVDNPMPEAANLARLFQYALDVCKFNAKIFTDEDLELLLARAMAICLNTNDPSDMENCIKLFDAVMTFARLPLAALRPCVEVLCTIHRMIQPLKEQTWTSLSNLFKSHAGSAAVLSLLHTLLLGPMHADRKPINVYKGIIQVLRLVLFDDGRSGLPKVPMSMLCPALKASIKEPDPDQEQLVIRLIDSVLAQTNLRDILFSETDVGDLVEIINICAERDDSRYCAAVSGTKVSSTTTKTSIDEKETLLSNPGSPNNGKLYTAFVPCLSNFVRSYNRTCGQQSRLRPRFFGADYIKTRSRPPQPRQPNSPSVGQTRWCRRSTGPRSERSYHEALPALFAPAWRCSH
jgi:hypothetical protein